jgi:putative membrane protein
MFGVDHHAFGGWWMIILWIALIALVLYLVFRFINQQGSRRNEGTTALDILNKRYAAGEISKEEYEEKKSELRDH